MPKRGARCNFGCLLLASHAWPATERGHDTICSPLPLLLYVGQQVLVLNDRDLVDLAGGDKVELLRRVGRRNGAEPHHLIPDVRVQW